MDNSYIKLSRKIMQWEWYKNEHTKNVFIHCLLKAYWKDTKIEGKIIPRGSFVSSVGKIAEELSLTPMEVRTALKHLNLTNEITSKGTSRNTVFTVTNYDLYQANEQAEQQTDNKQITSKEQTNNEQITNEQQTNNKPLTTNEEYKEYKEQEEIKEVKKGKKDTYLDERKQIIEYLNQRCGTRYSYSADYVKKNINARLRENHTIEEFYEVIDKKYEEWQGTEMEKFLRPQTLFGTKFENYLSQPLARNKKSADINANKQSQLDYLLNSIREEEMNGHTGC